MPAHVLVADDDPHILRMLSEVLSKRGFGVDVARDGDEAYERALAKAPDVLVTDVMMPKLDGWELVRKLRLDPRLANMPVIFLTAFATEDSRMKAFSLGADDYINKPFKFNDLVARIEKVLGAKRASDKNMGSGLAGDLAQVGLSTLLVLIEMERKTGTLQLSAADGRAGQIIVRQGKVIDATLDSGEHPSGARSVYSMLTWTSGAFAFEVRAVDGPDTIGLSTTHLLMEGARQMDEASSPTAEEQLDEEAIAEWSGEERTPVVVAAKLADFVRRTARASNPPYSAPMSSRPLEASMLANPTDTRTSGLATSLASSGLASTSVGSTKKASRLDLAIESAMPLEPDVETEPQPVREKEPAVVVDAVEKPRIEAEARPKARGTDPGKPVDHARVVAEPPKVARKRTSIWWLLLCLAIAGAGAFTLTVKTPASDAPAAAVSLRSDADAIAAVLDRAANTAQMRADGIAAMPMLRAGIETDAATLEDMVKNEMLLKPNAGEAMELFQLHDGKATSVLRLPAGAAAMSPDRVIDVDGASVRVIARAPVKTQKGTDAGMLAVAVSVDHAALEGSLAQRTRGATIAGLPQPVVLVPAAPGESQTVKESINAKAAQGLALEAKVGAPAAKIGKPPTWLVPVRYGCFALAGVLLVVFVGRSLRRDD